MDRLFIKVTREHLPQIKDRYPFLYLEYGRLEVDASSVKWISADGEVIPLPIGTICALMLGPGTSITHDAVRTCASANCMLGWTAQDTMTFYAGGISPTSTSRNFQRQIALSCDPEGSLAVARKMFSYRFPKEDILDSDLDTLMGMEGARVRQLYEDMSKKYLVGWKGRNYSAGNFELSDVTNKILSSSNAALYGILSAGVHSLGYSPHAGFIHKGSPLPFIYDLADLYKAGATIDLSFRLSKELKGRYCRKAVANEFRKTISEMKILESLSSTINKLLDV